MKTELKLQFGTVEYSDQHELLTIIEGVGRNNTLMFGIGETKLIYDFLSQLSFINSEYATPFPDQILPKLGFLACAKWQSEQGETGWVDLLAKLESDAIIDSEDINYKQAYENGFLDCIITIKNILGIKPERL